MIGSNYGNCILLLSLPLLALSSPVFPASQVCPGSTVPVPSTQYYCLKHEKIARETWQSASFTILLTRLETNTIIYFTTTLIYDKSNQLWQYMEEILHQRVKTPLTRKAPVKYSTIGKVFESAKNVTITWISSLAPCFSLLQKRIFTYWLIFWHKELEWYKITRDLQWLCIA